MESLAPQYELLPQLGADALGQWQPDETLFGLISRQHFISGSARDSDTTWRFFGHPTEGANHDFPARLDALVGRTRNVLGSAEDILWQRTTLLVYLIFRADHDRSIEVGRARVGGLGDIKARLGLLASRFGAVHPLKVCPACMEIERLGTGITYWHRAHQLPGLWVCPTHALPLRVSRSRANGSGRFQWALPQHDDCLPSTCSAQEWHVHRPILLRLRDFILTATERARIAPVDTGRLRQTLLTQLSGEQGKTTLRGTDPERLKQALEPYANALSQFQGYQALQGDEGVDRAMRILRRTGSTPHPLWWLVLSAALLDDVTQLWSPHGHAEAVKSDEPMEDLPRDSGLRVELKTLIAGGLSPTAAARRLNIAPGTALAWCAEAGLTTSQRPKKFTATVIRRLEIQLDLGLTQRQIAAVMDISIPSLGQLFRLNPELHARWKAACYQRRLKENRSSWSNALAKTKGMGILAARQLEPSAYSWLYDHDRSWLIQINDSQAAADRPRSISVRWDDRDGSLSEAVKRALLRATEEGLVGRSRRQRIFELVPALQPQLRSLHRLPLTRRSLRG